MKNIHFQEILLGLLCIGWAVWLLVFDSYHVSNVLSALRGWNVPEVLILTWLFSCGGGLIFLSPFWRKNIHFLMFAFWMFITFAIAETNITLTAIPIYITIALIHAGFAVTLDKKR